jgi:hypothetical protein
MRARGVVLGSCACAGMLFATGTVLQVIKKEIREHVIHDGTKAPMWFYLVHYMVRT